jgi:selenocysteine lyase/cysteine desulfurase
MPEPVAKELQRLVTLLEEEGPYNPEVSEGLRSGYDACRRRVAHLLGADESEITLTPNVTTGANIVANGLAWRPGDEVILSDEEHPGGALPWANLRLREGVAIRQVAVRGDHGRMLEELAGLITPRTRLIYVSHVSCVSGTRLPVREIAALARERGVLSMVDGAHAVGTRPVDVKELGCDFYTGCGHKWLFGPQGTGFLYLRGRRLEEVRQIWLGAGSTSSWDEETLAVVPLATAGRYEFGTRPWMLFNALDVAIGFKQELGLEAVQAHTVPLASALKAALADLPGVRLRTPLDVEASASLVAFEMPGLGEEHLGERLWKEHRIILPYNLQERWTRVSVACFTRWEELERLVNLLCGWLA